MAKALVDRLEVIDIEEEHCNLVRAAALVASKGVLDPLDERARFGSAVSESWKAW